MDPYWVHGVFLWGRFHKVVVQKKLFMFCEDWLNPPIQLVSNLLNRSLNYFFTHYLHLIFTACNSPAVQPKCDGYCWLYSVKRQEPRGNYPSHARATTFKALTGVLPCGAITYASKLLTGSISDKELTRIQESSSYWSQGDEIMADKGFLVEKLLGGQIDHSVFQAPKPVQPRGNWEDPGHSQPPFSPLNKQSGG